MVEDSGPLEAFGDLDLFETVVLMLLDAASEDEFHLRIRMSREILDKPVREHIGRSEPRVLTIVGDDEVFRSQMEMRKGFGALFGWLIIGKIDSRIDAVDPV